MSKLGEQLAQAAKCMHGECDHPKVEPATKIEIDRTLKAYKFKPETKIKAMLSGDGSSYKVWLKNAEGGDQIVDKMPKGIFDLYFTKDENAS